MTDEPAPEDEPAPDDPVDDRPGAPTADPVPGDPDGLSSRHASAGSRRPDGDREEDPQLDDESPPSTPDEENPEEIIEGLPGPGGPDESFQKRYRSDIGYLETFFRSRHREFADYQRLLNQARMARSYDEYLTRATLVSLAAGLAGALLGVLLAVLLARTGVLAGITTGLGGEFGTFVGQYRLPFAAVGLGVVLAAVLGGLTFAGFYYAPVLTVSGRRQEIEITLPQAIVFMYALSYGGMNLTEILRAVAEADDTYGEVAAEFDTVLRDLELFGNDTFTALQNLRNSTPSDGLEEFLDDLLGLLESGGDVTVFLEDAAADYLEEARDEQADFLETLAILSEVFIVGFVAAPLFLIVILVVISLVGGQTLLQVASLVYLVIPVGMASFIVLVDVLSSPFVQTGHVEAPDRGAFDGGAGAGEFQPIGAAAWADEDEPHRGPFSGSQAGDTAPTADTERLERTAADQPTTHEQSLLERTTAAVSDEGGPPSMPARPADRSGPTADGPADGATDGSGEGEADQQEAAAEPPDERIRSYRRARQLDSLRSIASNPMGLFRQRPNATLLVSVPVAVLVAAALVVTGVVETTYGALLDAPVFTTTGLVVLPLFLATLPLTYYHERKTRRERKLAERFPDTLNILASANKMGIGLTEGLGLVVRSSSGLVAEELRKVRNDIIWNASTGEALLAFGSRLEVPQLARTTRLLAEGLRSSGDLARVLSVAAEDARGRYRLERDRQREMVSYIAIVVIGFLVYLLVVVALEASYLAPVSETAAEQVEYVGEQRAPISFSDVPIEEYQLLFFHSAIIQGFGSGLLAGKLADNSIRSGLKYGLGLVALSVVVFAII
ncbi:type II secretion system F family protein [Haloglomus salinum]|uniref:type II secretion system F family protein n=1 Tax=Haloglomus salinum TaxID=2962673 RepID=UPI0020CA0C82|nr:type II secretion system F family protein [Haloglomus salinum]